jgi:hypothetical protein
MNLVPARIATWIEPSRIVESIVLEHDPTGSAQSEHGSVATTR